MRCFLAFFTDVTEPTFIVKFFLSRNNLSLRVLLPTLFYPMLLGICFPASSIAGANVVGSGSYLPFHHKKFSVLAKIAPLPRSLWSQSNVKPGGVLTPGSGISTPLLRTLLSSPTLPQAFCRRLTSHTSSSTSCSSLSQVWDFVLHSWKVRKNFVHTNSL